MISTIKVVLARLDSGIHKAEILSPLGQAQGKLLYDKMNELDQICFDIPWTQSALEEELLHPNAHNFALYDDSNLIGASLARIICDELWILRIMLHPNYRGRGFAQSMLMQQIELASKKGVSKSLLEVQTDNVSAINLYKKCGFEIISTRIKYYERNNDARADAYVMQRN